MTSVLSWIGVAAGMVALMGSGCGSAPGWPPAAPEVLETMPIYDPVPVMAKCEKLSLDEVLTLFARDDREFEKGIVGGIDARIVGDALYELERRMKGKGLALFSPEQRQRVISTTRKWLWEKFNLGNEPLIEFAATYDAPLTAKKFLQYPALIDWYPKIAFLAFAKGGREKEAWRLLKPRLNSLSESEVCSALMIIGINKLQFAADEVYKRTKALRWMIRLQALHTLDCLGDPRTKDALLAHLADIRRDGIGLRGLTLPGAMQAWMRSAYLRGELIRGLTRHKVPGAAATLERILTNPRERLHSIRCKAGQELTKVNRGRCIAAVRGLLQSRAQRDQLVGVSVAEFTLGPEIREDLRRAARISPFEEVREEAAQALHTIEMMTEDND